MKFEFNFTFNIKTIHIGKIKYIFQIKQSTYRIIDIRDISYNIINDIFQYKFSLSEEIPKPDFFIYLNHDKCLNEIFLFVIASKEDFSQINSLISFNGKQIKLHLEEELHDNSFILNNFEKIFETHLGYYIKSNNMLISGCYYLIEWLFSDEKRYNYYSFLRIDSISKKKITEKEYIDLNNKEKASKRKKVTKSKKEISKFNTKLNNLTKSMSLSTLSESDSSDFYRISIDFDFGILKFRFTENKEEESLLKNNSNSILRDFRYLTKNSVSYKKLYDEKYTVIGNAIELEYRSKPYYILLINQTMLILESFLRNKYLDGLILVNHIKVKASLSDISYRDSKIKYIESSIDNSNYLDRLRSDCLNILDNQPIHCKYTLSEIFERFSMFGNQELVKNYLIISIKSDPIEKYKFFKDNNLYVLYSEIVCFIDICSLTFDDFPLENLEENTTNLMSNSKQSIGKELLKPYNKDDIQLRQKCSVDYGDLKSDKRIEVEKKKREADKLKREKTIMRANSELSKDIREDYFIKGYKEIKKKNVKFSFNDDIDQKVRLKHSLLGSELN